jgi:hypothetical protein
MAIITHVQLDVFVEAISAHFDRQNVQIILVRLEHNSFFPFEMGLLAILTELKEMGYSWDFQNICTIQ